ncbi:MAG TPA: hypothetical protein VMA83_07530 [Solirubrobacteraceae bacterium]|nr:hypothetical protein [Solirubrobacteraceae bacterium]
MRTDPADNGGLFAGRRPGTAPVHYRATPERAGEQRRRVDGSLANVLFACMVVLSLLCWGPIPLACLWVGSQAQYVSGNADIGLLGALVALFVLLFGTLALLKRIDGAWILVRRAAGHDQRRGALGRIFGTTACICAAIFVFWFIVIQGPGSSLAPGNGAT